MKSSCSLVNSPRPHIPDVMVVLIGCLLVSVARAAEDSNTATVDKSQYHLFKPTPPELMRDMSTDRPDQLESPYSLDAGHFQFEMDVLRYSYDRYNPDRADVRVETVEIAPVNLKVGLCNKADLQLVLQPYLSVRTHDRESGSVRNTRGFGDTDVRLKVNLWGNDGGTTAFAVMPFVKLPTSQHDLGNNSVEGGLIFPIAIELPYGWSMGLMTEFDFIRDAMGRRHHTEFVNIINFNRAIIGKLSGFVELFTSVSTERDADWIGTFDTGVTYGLTEDIQLDAGVFIGLTRSAEDLNPFVGLSWRF
jgi:hypothetical protein